MAEEAQNLTANQRRSQTNAGMLAGIQPIFESDNVKGLGFVGASYESYMQNTWVGQGLRHGIDRGQSPFTSEYSPDPDFNVYAHWLENKDTHGDMERFVRNGYFDNVYSLKQYDVRRDLLQSQMEEEQRLVNANVAGTIFGGLASIVDISTLVPGYNLVKKVQVAGKIGKIITAKPTQFALMGAQQSVIQETGLHVLNDLHTIEESAIATVFTAGLGGGIGAFVAARNPNSVMNPRNPEYIFRPESKVMTGLKGFGESVSESSVVQASKRGYTTVADTNQGKSIGAAAVRSTELVKRVGAKVEGPVRKGVQVLGKAGEKAINKTVGVASPIVRMANAKSGKVRDFSKSLFDQGGILHMENTSGKFEASAEAISRFWNQRYMIATEVPMRESFEQLQLTLAEISGKGRAGRAVDKARRGGAAVMDLAKDVAAGPNNSGKVTGQSTRANTITMAEFTDIVKRNAYEDLDDEFIGELTERLGEDATGVILAAAKENSARLMKFNDEFADELIERGLMKPEDKVEFYVAPQQWIGKGIRANRAAAKDFFLRLFIDEPADDFLEEAYSMTRSQFDELGNADVTLTRGDEAEVITVAEGAAVRLEILEEWSANLRNDKSMQIEKALEDAEFEAELAQKEAVRAASELRKNNTEIKNASVEEAVALVKRQQNLINRKKAARKRLKTLKDQAQALVKKVAEEEKLRKAAVAKAIKGGRNKYKVKAASEVAEAKALLGMFEADGVKASARDVESARRNLIIADNNLARSGEQVGRDVNGKLLKKPVVNNRTSYLKGRLAELNKKLKEADGALVKLESELEPIRIKADTAVTRKQSAISLRKLLNAKKKEAGKTQRKSKRILKSAKKALRRDKGSPLDIYVDDLLKLMGKRNSASAPMSRMSDEIGESARLKKRMINLTNDQRREAESLGILDPDTFGAQRRAMQDVANRLALREKFGHLGSNEDEILESLTAQVRDEYEALIRGAKKSGESTTSLEKEMARRLKDVEKSIMRFMGRLDMPSDPEGMLGFILSKAREWNYTRYGSGFLIASLTDVSNAALATGFGTFSRRNFDQAHKTMAGMGNDEIRRLVYSMELMNHNNRSMTFTGSDDLRLQQGVGEYGSWKHYTTSTADRISRELADATTMASGMRFWNSRLKLMAQTEMQHNILRVLDNYDDLLAAASAKDPDAMRDISNLASTGVGAEQIARIKRVMGSTRPKPNEFGVLELNMERWLDKGKEGQTAYQDVLMALDMAATRAVMTPGRGDTPFFMSSEMGKMMLQFQTYGFVVMTKYMLPAFQRMGHFGDLQAFGTFALSLVAGSTVVAAKDMLRYGEIQERSMAQWSYDTVDRSGFLTWLSTPIDQAVTHLGLSEGSSRYSRQNARLSLIGGPSAGLAVDIYDTALGESSDQRIRAAQKLTPFKLYQQIYDVIVNGDD